MRGTSFLENRWIRRLARTSAVLVVLVTCASQPVVASAIPASGPHETVDIHASTKRPRTPASLTYAATYQNPANASANPPPLRHLVISLPRGTHIDTSVQARCYASDQEIRLFGDGACPDASREGSGQVTADIVGLGRMTFNTTLFNAPDQQIEVVESGNAVGSDGVVRTYVHGTTLDGPVPTCFAGGDPPSGCPFDQVILLENHLTMVPYTVGHGRGRRSSALTPARCPPSRRWRVPVTLSYADGTRERVVPYQPCKRRRV